MALKFGWSALFIKSNIALSAVVKTAPASRIRWRATARSCGLKLWYGIRHYETTTSQVMLLNPGNGAAYSTGTNKITQHTKSVPFTFDLKQRRKRHELRRQKRGGPTQSEEHKHGLQYHTKVPRDTKE
jgi:hypothetical protein